MAGNCEKNAVCSCKSVWWFTSRPACVQVICNYLQQEMSFVSKSSFVEVSIFSHTINAALTQNAKAMLPGPVVTL